MDPILLHPCAFLVDLPFTLPMLLPSLLTYRHLHFMQNTSSAAFFTPPSLWWGDRCGGGASGKMKRFWHCLELGFSGPHAQRVVLANPYFGDSCTVFEST